MSSENDEYCPHCEQKIAHTPHGEVCEKVQDTPFNSVGMAHRDDETEQQECPMCGEAYDSYLDHIKECPGGDDA